MFSPRDRSLLLACALLVAAACGGGGGGGRNDNTDPTPVRTPTPVATPAATPTGPTSVAVVRVSASTSIQGVQLSIGYPTAKGAFAGSGDQVSCVTLTAGTVTLNDRDDGTLIFSIARATNLVLPVELRCNFVNAGSTATLTRGDLTVAVSEVTVDNAVGDPSAVAVAVAVE